jgi:FAD/FMN-containing dehydrogenase
VSEPVRSESSVTLPAPAVRSLRACLKGGVIERDKYGWDEATQAFNLTVIQQPALVAFPADKEDVIAIVEFARANGMRVAAQRTGHGAGPLLALDDVILVRTDNLKSVEIDAGRRTARVGAGATWAQVIPPASDLGLAALHGTSDGVGVAGYSLGGGIGWYARKLGLAANSITAVELVTADGRLRRVDADRDADLFWAVRGGGGNFGLVTALELDLYAIPDIYAGALFFPRERSSDVLKTWLEWTDTVPDEVTSVARILQFPPLAEVPEQLRGGRFAIVEAVYIGDEASGSDLLRPLREVGPAMDTFGMTPPAGVADLHMNPPQPLPYVAEGQVLGPLDEEAIDRFVEAAGPASGSPLAFAEIRHAGGALSQPQPHNGALSTLDADYLAFAVAMAQSEEMRRAGRSQLDTIAEALRPYDNGRAYPNFAERRVDPARFYTPAVYRRLRELKRTFDPRDLFRANHPIAPA